jgi:hypothetical protein
MPRDGAIISHNLAGKLDMIRVPGRLQKMNESQIK